ncbi:site-specific DNA-methyltransferase [Nitrosomonas oligotropha]|uniref:site-specific DNA-methyltransferase n=1 Tax=Nitrosomonas oligotropha TaxID=42354 RepID=UPI00137088F1|nr:site-specific DNA-methyltransferase [Nitrosomonas oligotropha]MXS82232.1 site-specific DNA-methyltransferase [Nitrosomonas oligotropha]
MADNESEQKPQQEALLDDEFSLQSRQAAPGAAMTRKEPAAKQPSGQRKDLSQAAEVLSYRHDDKRTNNPYVGMVDTHSDGVEGKTAWQYDPHIDPALNFDSSRSTIETLIDDALASGDKEQMQAALEQLKRMQSPYLNWSGKAERTSFSVDTVSLHVHERIDPATILAAVQKKLKDGKGKPSASIQPDLFHAPFENLPLREAIDFYKHDRDWANRLIAGDSLLVMNSLLQKEGMAGQVQMIYLDPPYGIKYGSNFQPFVNKRDVKDRSDEDLTQEPEMIKAFRDTWELGIHSYLTYLRDRLLLAKELLHESGSVFVQISDENVHLMRNLLDEIFDVKNFCSEIVFRKKTMPMGSDYFESVCDYILWYAKDKSKVKTKNLRKNMDVQGDSIWSWIELPDYSRQRMTRGEIDNHRLLPTGSKVYRLVSLLPAQYRPNQDFVFEYNGLSYNPPSNSCWKTNREGMQLLAKANRLQSQGKGLQQIMFADDYPVSSLTALWSDTGGASDKTYVVQTSITPLERCLLASTDPGDLVLDPTCGSGTTAFVAEKWGRRWITADTSRVAVTLAKQRLMTASYDYYALKYPHEGLRSGFIYKTVPHVTLKSIANNPEIDEIYARMHPGIENALAALNRSLSDSASFPRRRESSDATKTLDSRLRGNDDSAGQSRNDDGLKEWEVPFDFPVDWPEAAKKPFDAFHAARQAMQKQMDASIAAHAGQEILYDQPTVSKSKLRITGPFTVEAVPFATVLGLDEAEQPKEADIAVARSGATWRQSQWRDELLKAGIRGKGGQKIQLLDLVPLPGAKYIHAIGTVADTGDKVAVSFGPEHAALEQRQVEIAMREAGELFPLPKMLVFCAFTFDPEAAKDIDTIKGITALRVQMNTDLLTEDLKKGRASNESFWLMGQPDVVVKQIKAGCYQVEVRGFDYFDTKTGELKSGGKKNIAMWALDTDYDNRSLFPRQVFFPMAGSGDGWNKLRKDIRAELNEELLEQFHGTVSLPFEAGENECIAVKIVDDRGIESLKVINLDRIAV